MFVLIFRLLIVWLSLTCIIRLMGKRQIGEMQMSEMVTALLLSELAATPVTDTQFPLLFSVLPMLLLAVIEILTSCLLLRFRRLRKLVAGAPVILIRGGNIDQDAMRRIRMSIPELMAELRQKGLSGPSDAAYAILEENGKLSVLPRKAAQPPDAEKLGLTVAETGICHTLIADGAFSISGLSLSGIRAEDVCAVLKENGYRGPEEIFLMTADDAQQIRILPKHSAAKKHETDR